MKNLFKRLSINLKIFVVPIVPQNKKEKLIHSSDEYKFFKFSNKKNGARKFVNTTEYLVQTITLL